MMRYTLIILFLIFSGCSAQWHLKQALKKDSSIIDTKADTSILIDTNYRDSSVFWQFQKNFAFQDEMRDTNTIKILQNDTVRTLNRDSSLTLLTWIKNNKVFTHTSVRKDTTIIYRDTTHIAIPYFTEIQTITKQKEAVITQIKSFWDKLEQTGKIIAFAVAIFIGLALLYLIFRIFRK